MLKTILITLVALGVIGAVGVAWAKRSGYCSAEHRIHHVTERVGSKLDLNADQQGRLEAFAETLRGLREERRDRRDGIKEGVTELLAAPSLDRDGAMAMMDERLQRMADSKRALVDAFAEFSDSLAPEQRTRLAELISDRMSPRWGHPRWAH